VTLPKRLVPKVVRPGKPVSREAAGLLFADLDADEEKGILNRPSTKPLTPTETLFFQRLQERGLPRPDREWRFSTERRWRFDYGFPEHKLALEVDGGLFLPGGGRHNRALGMLKDAEKFNEAAVLGWRVLKVQPKFLANFATLDLIARALAWVPGT
jgi:very-short-patch-repair endonuclease